MAQKTVPSTFNELHTAFVTTEDGMSVAELLQVLGCVSVAPVLVPLLTPWVVPPSFVKQAVASKDFFFLIRAILEYPVLAVFPIWVLTLFAGNEKDDSSCSGAVLVFILCAAVGILIVNHAITAPKWRGFFTHWNRIKDLPTGWNSTPSQSGTTDASRMKLPFITNYRGIVIYITILSILAVDFSIFPRRFAKTKAYGVSLMDVGTGCFIFVNGIVSPEARNRQTPLTKSLKSAVPLVLLGLIRLITVKGIEYQEVVEEYGVHWNFFFTLAGIKILSSLIFTSFNRSHGLKLSLLICGLHEGLLSFKDLQNDFILNPNIPRTTNLLYANREGIFSLIGYLSIYMASVYFGSLIYRKQRTTTRDWIDYTCQTLLQISILWGMFGICVSYGIKPCRRTSNMGYILFMVALNYSLLWFQMFIALLLVCLQHLGLSYGPMIFYELATFHQKEKERISNLQKRSRDFGIIKERGLNEKEAEKADSKLQILEHRLHAASEKLDNQESRNFQDVMTEITEIENEMNKLEEYFLSQEHAKSGGSEEEKNRKLVVLPDLTKSHVILEAICYNGLAVFLLGNLLTGLINCMIYTMYTPPYLSLCYLWFYSTVIFAFSVTLYWHQIQLKFW